MALRGDVSSHKKKERRNLYHNTPAGSIDSDTTISGGEGARVGIEGGHAAIVRAARCAVAHEPVVVGVAPLRGTVLKQRAPLRGTVLKQRVGVGVGAFVPGVRIMGGTD
jgi:hypothetical protein